MKHVLQWINYANFLQQFWKEYKFLKMVIRKTVFQNLQVFAIAKV